MGGNFVLREYLNSSASTDATRKGLQLVLSVGGPPSPPPPRPSPLPPLSLST